MILTVAIPWSFDLNRVTKRVDRITDANGAAADIQNSFGFRNPYIPHALATCTIYIL